ncbi:substrate-binding periplasmic protein [Alteromonas facilis]|uniref:substrate-binding periplasmic protein n=1 Tax=Alteromonas facilis TaxID=2048004 RepID=UPI000C28BAD3|nr:transporter substrate-binding domain-containing protein [Alteromonas facilis]
MPHYVLWEYAIKVFKAVNRLVFVGVVTIMATSYAHACRILSSVSPEFPNGLHAKYLDYIAKEAKCELDIFPMPFARRVASLRSGEINLMVGIKSLHKEVGFEFLQPSYETLQSTYFVRAADFSKYTTKDSFRQANAALTIDNESMLTRAQDLFSAIVTVSNLEQKIRLLQIGRVDTFVHFESSAQYMIHQMGLQNELVPAAIQISQPLEYFVAIHTLSSLYESKDKLEAVIAEGVRKGDFIRLRREHEAILEQSTATSIGTSR